MGISTTQAFNDIVTGLGRMSPLILDNLGITVDLEATTAKYAATLGKSADALTDAERKQALVNAVMESSASLMEDANASAQNLAGQGCTTEHGMGELPEVAGQVDSPFWMHGRLRLPHFCSLLVVG